jgi:hypothetical protein
MLLALLLAAELAASAAGARDADRVVRAARRVGPIKIDGKLDEPAWLAAEEGRGFTQINPEEGKPSPVATRFRVLWDEEALYIGMECDDPEKPVAYLSRRDRWVEGDRVDIDIETTNDRRTAYHFSVYAAGQQLDALHYNDTDSTTDWDATWESAVAITPRGWSLEMRIPLRQLNIPEARSRGGSGCPTTRPATSAPRWAGWSASKASARCTSWSFGPTSPPAPCGPRPRPATSPPPAGSTPAPRWA